MTGVWSPKKPQHIGSHSYTVNFVLPILYVAVLGCLDKIRVYLLVAPANVATAWISSVVLMFLPTAEATLRTVLHGTDGMKVSSAHQNWISRNDTEQKLVYISARNQAGSVCMRPCGRETQCHATSCPFGVP